MEEAQKKPPGRGERLVRALLLLAASLFFSSLAWLLGLYRLENPVWLYAMAGSVIILALLASRFGTRLIMRRLITRNGARDG